MSKSVDELCNEYLGSGSHIVCVDSFKAGFAARDSEVQWLTYKLGTEVASWATIVSKEKDQKIEALREALACAEGALDEAEVMLKDVYRVNQAYKGDFHVTCPESKFKNALTRIAVIKKANGIL